MRWFRQKTEADEEGFYPTRLPAAAVAEGTMHSVTVAGKAAIVTRVEGRLYAFSHVCPHAAADLREGPLRRGQIKCADHGYTFDVRSGRAVWPPGEGCHLTRYAVKEADGMVKLQPHGR